MTRPASTAVSIDQLKRSTVASAKPEGSATHDQGSAGGQASAPA